MNNISQVAKLDFILPIFTNIGKIRANWVLHFLQEVKYTMFLSSLFCYIKLKRHKVYINKKKGGTLTLPDLGLNAATTELILIQIGMAGGTAVVTKYY